MEGFPAFADELTDDMLAKEAPSSSLGARQLQAQTGPAGKPVTEGRSQVQRPRRQAEKPKADFNTNAKSFLPKKYQPKEETKNQLPEMTYQPKVKQD